MLEIELKQAQAELPELIEAATQGEEVIITRAAQPIAKLVSLARREGDLILGSAKGLITFSEDFDEPLEDFAEYR
jgi:prevent-host-death family protein